jgi:hypothetical protein
MMTKNPAQSRAQDLGFRYQAPGVYVHEDGRRIVSQDRKWHLVSGSGDMHARVFKSLSAVCAAVCFDASAQKFVKEAPRRQTLAAETWGKSRSRDDVNAAIKAFFAGVEALAKSQGLPDVLVAVAVNVDYGDAPGRAMSTTGWGDMFQQPALAAYALGRAQDEVRKRINQLAIGGGK